MSLIDDPKKDFKWYQEDRASYEAEQAREVDEYDRQLKEHMGGYEKEPLTYTKKEFEIEIDKTLVKIKRLKELKAPEGIIEFEQEFVEELSKSLYNGEYMKTQEEKQYRKAYDIRKDRFEFKFEARVPEEFQ
jgi:hypothetical protein